jgi:hypothetical protein
MTTAIAHYTLTAMSKGGATLWVLTQSMKPKFCAMNLSIWEFCNVARTRTFEAANQL